MRTRDVILLVILVVLLFIVGYLVWGKKADNNAQPAGQEQTSTTTVSASSTEAAASSTTSTETAKKTIKTTTKAPLSVTQKYLDALKVYKNAGYYFQFLNCHASPGTLTMKAGRKFMLDNKDNVTRSIKIVGGQSFRITAYNYAIATAPYKEGVYYITCDGGGSAQIKVQL
jgi:hypothetical protein